MILDTNALSACATGADEIRDHLLAATELFLPVIVLGEYRFGILQSRRRVENERWLTRFVEDCQTLAVDAETASEYALLRNELKVQGRPIPTNDLWIAALCRQHRRPLLTRDAHFQGIKGIRVISW